MAWLNIIAILILHKPALLALKDYEAQRKAGQDPQFDPDALGIKNADLWRERSEEHTSELQSLMRISYAVFCLKKQIYLYKGTHTLTTFIHLKMQKSKTQQHILTAIYVY